MTPRTPPSSPQPSERQAAGKTGPGTGEADPGINMHASPGRGRTQTPVTAVPDEQPASGPATVTGQNPAGASGPDSPPAGSTEEERAAQRKTWQAAESALKHKQRAQRGRYTRVADRGAAARLKPGMGRRAAHLDEGTGEAS